LVEGFGEVEQVGETLVVVLVGGEGEPLGMVPATGAGRRESARAVSYLVGEVEQVGDTLAVVLVGGEGVSLAGFGVVKRVTTRTWTQQASAMVTGVRRPGNVHDANVHRSVSRAPLKADRTGLWAVGRELEPKGLRSGDAGVACDGARGEDGGFLRRRIAPLAP
jgi:hypothetical protein